MRQKKFNVMQSADSNEHVGIWYVNDVQTSEINEAVYAVFCVVAQAVLDRSKCFISGDHTAAEIAGSLGSRWCKALVPLTDEHYTMAPETVIKVGGNTYDRKGVLFECRFQTEEVFFEMAEWEGVMSLTKQKQHTFGCECCQESFKNAPLKPYARCHQSKAANPYSAARETTRINKKFDVIGPMSEALGSEGMKRALAVLTAVKSIGKLHGHEMQDLAGQLLRRKLWKDYGTCERLKQRMAWLKSEGERLRQDGKDKGDRYKKLKEEFEGIQGRIPALSQPMLYSAKDFQCGPECWKVVDNDYVKELMTYFNKVLAENKKPEWPAADDMVQIKNQGTAPKKWQGKLKVNFVYGQLDRYHDKINWYAEVCTTKGKYDYMNREIGWFVPWVEPEKPSKKTVSKKEKVEKKAPVKPQPAENHAAPTMTIEDRLRAALRRQLAMAA